MARQRAQSIWATMGQMASFKPVARAKSSKLKRETAYTYTLGTPGKDARMIGQSPHIPIQYRNYDPSIPQYAPEKPRTPHEKRIDIQKAVWARGQGSYLPIQTRERAQSARNALKPQMPYYSQEAKEQRIEKRERANLFFGPTPSPASIAYASKPKKLISKEVAQNFHEDMLRSSTPRFGGKVILFSKDDEPLRREKEAETPIRRILKEHRIYYTPSSHESGSHILGEAGLQKILARGSKYSETGMYKPYEVAAKEELQRKGMAQQASSRRMISTDEFTKGSKKGKITTGSFADIDFTNPISPEEYKEMSEEGRERWEAEKHQRFQELQFTAPATEMDIGRRMRDDATVSWQLANRPFTVPSPKPQSEKYKHRQIYTSVKNIPEEYEKIREEVPSDQEAIEKLTYKLRHEPRQTKNREKLPWRIAEALGKKDPALGNLAAGYAPAPIRDTYSNFLAKTEGKYPSEAIKNTYDYYAKQGFDKTKLHRELYSELEKDLPQTAKSTLWNYGKEQAKIPQEQLPTDRKEIIEKLTQQDLARVASETAKQKALAKNILTHRQERHFATYGGKQPFKEEEATFATATTTNRSTGKEFPDMIVRNAKELVKIAKEAHENEDRQTLSSARKGMRALDQYVEKEALKRGEEGSKAYEARLEEGLPTTPGKVNLIEQMREGKTISAEEDIKWTPRSAGMPTQEEKEERLLQAYMAEAPQEQGSVRLSPEDAAIAEEKEATYAKNHPHATTEEAAEAK